jgi:hypothetical protein
MRIRVAIAAVALATAVGVNAEADNAAPFTIATLNQNADRDQALATPSHLHPVGQEVPVADLDEPALRVLLSSVEITVNLLDAYGHCRAEGMPHAPCMSIIRSTLGHARNLIGKPPPQPTR